MKRVSVKDVARTAGVSVASVSRYYHKPDSLTEETRLKVEAAISDTGYTPNALARDLRRGHTNIVLAIVPSIGTPFFGEVMRGIQSVAARSNLSIIVEEMDSTSDQGERIASKLVSKQIDGMILLASAPPFDTKFLKMPDKTRRPVVVACEYISPELSRLPSVHIDNYMAAKEATLFLLSRGHRRIGLISGQDGSILMADRESGYRAAMQDANIAVDESWIVHGNLTLVGASEATRDLLSRPDRFSAILCLNDEMAIACISEVKKAGLRVPEDVSVMGFDDIPIGEYLDPPLTTVRQPAEEIGRRAMHRLLLEIKEGTEAEGATEIVDHSIVIRKTVAQANGS